jgi:hypothetical protein
MDIEIINKMERKITELGFVESYTWGNGDWNGREGKTYKIADNIKIYAYLDHNGNAWFELGTQNTNDENKLQKQFETLILIKEETEQQSTSSFYLDGTDYSHLEVNGFTVPEHEECVNCGSKQTTITDDADICHDCGYVYT